MWNYIREILLGEGALFLDRHGTETTREVRIAAAVILLEAAAGDCDISKSEEKEIIRLLTYEFNATRAEVRGLIEEADELRLRSLGVKQMVLQIKDSFTEEQRIEALSLVWRVIKIDNVVEDFEKLFTESLAPMLDLDAKQAEMARGRAEEQLRARRQ